jgi:hypothetical protein
VAQQNWRQEAQDDKIDALTRKLVRHKWKQSDVRAASGAYSDAENAA